MKINLFLAAILFFAMCLPAQAQKKNNKDEEMGEYDENYEFKDTKTVSLNIGIGLGLDYGGIGGKIAVLPSPHVAVFGGLGYNLNGLGYNVGVAGRFLPEAKACPYVAVMYGYNAVVVVDGMDSENKTYYGATAAAGVELKTRNGKFWNFGLVLPFRSSEYHDQVDRLMNDPNIEMTEPLPIGFTVGYHFPL
jgi:hypothetical protein